MKNFAMLLLLVLLPALAKSEEFLPQQKSRGGIITTTFRCEDFSLELKTRGSLTILKVTKYVTNELNLDMNRSGLLTLNAYGEWVMDTVHIFASEDHSYSHHNMYAMSQEFRLVDWGGFLVIQVYDLEASAFDRAHIFRFYADGSVGRMSGEEFWGFIINGGHRFFLATETRPQYYVPAASGKTTTTSAISWGEVKSGGDDNVEAASIRELFLK